MIDKGMARYFYYQDDKELTGWIDLEGDIVGSVFCALELGPAQESIQLLEDSDLYEIALDEIRQDRLFYEGFKAQILQYYFIELEKRVKFFQSLGGKERYEYLLRHKPELIRRVPLHIIASYIGMTPESLSRIRGSIS